MFVTNPNQLEFLASGLAAQHKVWYFSSNNPTQSEIFIVNPLNVEHVLKTNFSNYRMANNGLYGYEEMLMECTLDSIFKVGFGIELNSLSGSGEVGNKFAHAFAEANVDVFWRFGHKREQMKMAKGNDRKSAVKDDILPDGLRVKKGDGIIYVPYAMGRMTFIWSEDAEDFRPDRWIVNGVFQLESPFKFSAFQGLYGHVVMMDLFGDGIFAVDGDKWRHQRKLASHEFSTKVLRDFSSLVFFANATKLVEKVSDAATSNMLIDLQEVLMKSTLDSIFKVGFEIEINSLSLSDEGGIKFARLSTIIKRVLNIGSETILKRDIKVIDNYVLPFIGRKREQMKTVKGNKWTKEDILLRFLVESEKDPENMTDKYLRDVILSLLIAGRDTTANTLTWFFYMLCKHSFVQEKVFQEIREATKGIGSLSIDEFMKLVTEDVLDSMQYLQAALPETLRIYPPVASDRKSAVNDDILPDRFKVKKGDNSICTLRNGKDGIYLGRRCRGFPARKTDLKWSFPSRKPFQIYRFSVTETELGFDVQAGPRICLGKEFAYRQMKIFAVFLLNFFKFKLATNKLKLNIEQCSLFTRITGFSCLPLTEKMSYNHSLLANNLLKKLAMEHLLLQPWISLAGTVLAILVVALYAFRVLRRRSSKKYHPIAGTIFNQLLNFKRLHHYMTDLAFKYKTYRLLGPFRSEVYTSDPANVEYILKTNFENYGKDLFMKSTLDSIFKVAFGVELDSMCGSNEEGTKFANAFDDSSAMTLCLYKKKWAKCSKKVRASVWCIGQIRVSTHATWLLSSNQHLVMQQDAKICFSDDILPDGFNVSKGNMVSYQPYAMGRMKYIWGDDAEDFRPERWLNDEGFFQSESPFKFTAFQAGPPICLGKEFAYRQMKIFFAVVLAHFTFSPSDNKKDVNYRTMINLHIDGGLHLRAFHR
ncbi:hypothetical protein GIB67_019068 [Kingdonia uniflora]|uniref:Cytochrome P450 n=1 Tax=Kingdonia uniflora TaxID=39325 RepID=A0A7J7MZD0_9MAGN|nr:hypothetical protein GIB67_019068 [Kingdonia uniflora]